MDITAASEAAGTGSIPVGRTTLLPQTMTETHISGSVREATSADARAILRIYAPHVESSAVSFELSLPNLQTS